MNLLSDQDKQVLSLCSRSLKPYTDYLEKLRVVSNSRDKKTTERSLSGILQGKRAVAELHLTHENVFLALRVVPDNLQTLDLSGCNPNTCATHLSTFLSDGCLRNLKVLAVPGPNKLSSFVFGPGMSCETLRLLCTPLASGACPRLRILDLSYNGFSRYEDFPGEVIGSLLASGSLRELEELDLSECYLNGTLDAVYKALEKGACPNFRALHHPMYPFDGVNSDAVVNLIESGACPKLEHINGDVLDRSFSFVASALVMGKVPKLKHLCVNRNSDGAVAGVLASGVCAHLETLSVSCHFQDLYASSQLFSSLASGLLPQIRILRLSDARLSFEEGADVPLALAILSGSLANLQELSFSWCVGNPSAIFNALTTGACPRMKTLGFVRTTIVSSAVDPLVGFLSSSHGANLTELVLSRAFQEHRGLLKVLATLRSGACPLLHKLDIFPHYGPQQATDAVCWSLARVVCSGYLCKLKTLYVNTTHVRDTTLLRAVGEGHLPCLETLNVQCVFAKEAVKVLTSGLKRNRLGSLRVIRIDLATSLSLAGVYAFIESLSNGAPNVVYVSVSPFSTHAYPECNDLVTKLATSGQLPRLRRAKILSSTLDF